MTFAAVIQLSALNGTDGFRLSGRAADDRSGWSVASAGDINNDGFDDLIIGAPGADFNGPDSGAGYVVFGKSSGFSANFDLSTLDGTNGFRIRGQFGSDLSSRSVASAGDVNGDGFDDLIIGAHGADPNGHYSGATFVVFGKGTAFTADFDLWSLDGTNGFKLSGGTAFISSGRAVASAGDINNDGYDDLLIAAPFASPNGDQSGASYVVYGRAAGFDANLNLSTLDGTLGFQISGVAANHFSGWSAASAGDVNNDGFDDLIIGSKGASATGDGSGISFVVFGKDTSFGANFNLSTLDGTNGFRINGEATWDESGVSVASAGDVNGDGLGDLIIGAHYADPNVNEAGASYVVFGKSTGFVADLNLSTLDGANGFKISGQAENESSGYSVASAGDVNNDGFDDLIVGAWRATANGNTSAGASYVVFGKSSGFAANLNVSALDSTNGFRINGVALGDTSGRVVASAGDINNDGFDDLIIGAPHADPNGTSSGASYVIFGQLSNRFFGTAGEDDLSGTAGGDSADGGAGKDVLRGLGGDDILGGGDANDQLFGGDNTDTLSGDAGSDILYGDDGTDTLNGGDGADKLFGGTGEDQLNGGTGNDRMAGEADIDTLNGGAGNDYLDGGLGADVMSGGTDNDVYIVDNLGDQTIELVGEGYDIVRTAIDDWVLAANVEALQLQGSADVDGTGNSAANNLQGNSGANVLSGLAGVDTINGNDGNDTIIGGLGNDLLRGGSGADTFAVAHAFGGVLESDQVYDFSTAEGDILDLSGAFGGTLVLVTSFTGAAGEMTLSFAAGQTTLRLDINGGGTPDYQLKINGDVTGDSAGWVL